MKHTCLFLPDISGFTQFVKSVEIDHSQHIITELLELLIDQNQLGFELAEIEGDALFYYKKEEVPDIGEIRDQIQKMFQAFHRHLMLYETHRICHCGACSTASNLQLKFFVHCGPTRFIQVKNSIKPFGEPVIEAHRLMKNSISLREYILFTHDYLSGKGVALTKEIHEGSDVYDGSTLRYGYQDISSWDKDIELSPMHGQGNATQFLWKKEFIVDIPREAFFEILTNFKYRHYFIEAKSIEYNKKLINRAGEKHICVFTKGRETFETLKRDFGDGSWVVGERLTFIPGYKYMELYYLVHAEGKEKTRVEARLFGQPGRLAFLVKPMVMIKSKKDLFEVFNKLKDIAERKPSLVLVD